MLFCFRAASTSHNWQNPEFGSYQKILKEDVQSSVRDLKLKRNRVIHQDKSKAYIERVYLKWSGLVKVLNPIEMLWQFVFGSHPTWLNEINSALKTGPEFLYRDVKDISLREHTASALREKECVAVHLWWTVLRLRRFFCDAGPAVDGWSSVTHVLAAVISN